MKSFPSRRGPARFGALLFFVSLLLYAGVGCGGGKGDVSGTVTYQGKKLVVGTVVAVGSDGLPKTVNIKEDGTYAVTELPAGTILFAVHSPEPKNLTEEEIQRLKDRKKIFKGEKEAYIPPQVDPKLWFPIDEKYSDPKSSGLTFELPAGSHTHNLELK